jgi:hypothetical protein
VKFHTLANIENPLGGIGVGFPALGQFSDQFAAGCDFGQVVAQLPELHVLHVGVQDLTRVQHVTGRATGQPLPEPATFLRSGPCRFAVKQGRHRSHTHGHRCGQEFAATQAVFRNQSLQKFNFVVLIHNAPPVRVFLRYRPVMAIWFALSGDYNPEYVVDRNNIFLDIEEIARWVQKLRSKKEAERLYFETRGR